MTAITVDHIVAKEERAFQTSIVPVVKEITLYSKYEMEFRILLLQRLISFDTREVQ